MNNIKGIFVKNGPRKEKYTNLKELLDDLVGLPITEETIEHINPHLRKFDLELYYIDEKYIIFTDLRVGMQMMYVEVAKNEDKKTN